jgi:hypothetical protein
MKKTTTRKAKKLVVGRDTVRALTPQELAPVAGAVAGPPGPPANASNQGVTTDSKKVCCA